MDSSRAVRSRVRVSTIIAAVLVGAVAAVRPIAAALDPHGEPGAELLAVVWPAALAVAGVLLLSRFEWRQRAIVKELGRVRVVDRDADAFESRMVAELRQVQEFHRKIAYRLLALDERLTHVQRSVENIARSTETLPGDIRALDDAITKAIDAARWQGYAARLREECGEDDEGDEGGNVIPFSRD